jgi:hypothetical protein
MVGASIFVLGLGALGIYLILRFLKKFKKQIETIQGTPLSDVGTLQPGLRKATGTTVALDKPLQSPLTQTECIFYHFRVDELRSSQTRTRAPGGRGTRVQSRSYWETVVNDKQAVNCGLQDATGTATVDLLGAELVLKSGTMKQSSMLQSCPPELKELLQRRYSLSTKGLLFSKSLRYIEQIIRPGDKLFVLGDVEANPGQPPAFVKKESSFIVSDKDEAGVLSHLRRCVIGCRVGLGFVVVFALLFAAFPIYAITKTSNTPVAAGKAQPAPAGAAKKPQDRQVVAKPEPVAPRPAPAAVPTADTRVSAPVQPKVTPPPQVANSAPAEPTIRTLSQPRLIIPIETRVYIINAANGRLLESDRDKNNRDGTALVLRSKEGQDAPYRQWILRRVENSEYFTIAHVESNRLIDAERKSSNRDGTKVQLFGTQIQGNKERLWYFQPAGGDAVYIISATGRYLDADEFTLDKKTTNVRLWGKAGEDKPQRKWTIVKAQP